MFISTRDVESYTKSFHRQHCSEWCYSSVIRKVETIRGLSSKSEPSVQINTSSFLWLLEYDNSIGMYTLSSSRPSNSNRFNSESNSSIPSSVLSVIIILSYGSAK